MLKQKYSGFSKDLIQVFLNSCNEWQLQKCKKQLKSTVTKPIRSSNFASRGKIDLIDFQNTPEINRPYNFLMVCQDHITKFVILRPLRNKSAVEVTDNLLDIFCLFGPLATMIREKWPECNIIHGKARHPQSQGSVERVNREIKKVLGSLIRKTNDPCWVKYVNLAQYSINTSPHSTLQNNIPYRILFGRETCSRIGKLWYPRRDCCGCNYRGRNESVS